MTNIKEDIICKLQKLCSLPRSLRAVNLLPALFLKKPLCMGDLLPACNIFIEMPVMGFGMLVFFTNLILMEFEVRYLALFHLFSVMDNFE